MSPWVLRFTLPCRQLAALRSCKKPYVSMCCPARGTWELAGGGFSPTFSWLVKQHLVEVESRIFDLYGDRHSNTINVQKFINGLTATGLRKNDPRIRDLFHQLQVIQDKETSLDTEFFRLDYEEFIGAISENIEIIVKAFTSSLVIPDFQGFCKHIKDIYLTCKENNTGQVASYIPQLSRVDPSQWGVAVCTVDGQRFSLGNVNVPFTLQSCGKPVTYALAVGELGATVVHERMGMEPSGRIFNELCLDENKRPHNPLINSGAILTSSMLKPELSAADRFDYVFQMYKRLCGSEYVGFNNAVFLSERECADRNFALAYFMRENGCFPRDTKLVEMLDFYFQLCSLEISVESGAMIAATLANGGVQPLTGDPILTNEAVRNTLTLMHSCGMYNYSGQFAFRVGLPAKSGVSGCILLVVPNTMGLCLWSPLLDTNGNSCRGVDFCKGLVDVFKFHNFDNLRGTISCKIDPRMGKHESRIQVLFDLLFSVAAGDLSSLRRHALSGTNMDEADYDGRTALHIAASEGHGDLVEFLLHNCGVTPDPKDRWGRTPLEDACNFKHQKCVEAIERFLLHRGEAAENPS